MEESATDAWAKLVAAIDKLCRGLSRSERDAVMWFLERIADSAEQHANRLARGADARAQSALAVPLPALWG